MANARYSEKAADEQGNTAHSALQVSPHIGGKRPHREYRVAEPGFGAVQQLAPIIDFDAGGQIEPGGIGRR